jgi:hypothetical protein
LTQPLPRLPEAVFDVGVGHLSLAADEEMIRVEALPVSHA